VSRKANLAPCFLSLQRKVWPVLVCLHVTLCIPFYKVVIVVMAGGRIRLNLSFSIPFHTTNRHGLVFWGCNDYLVGVKSSLINVNKFGLWYDKLGLFCIGLYSWLWWVWVKHTHVKKKKKKLKITSILCEDIQNCVHYGQVILKIHFFTYFYQDKKAIFFSKFFLFAFNKNTCFTIKI
jgi:hypothetical protein